MQTYSTRFSILASRKRKENIAQRINIKNMPRTAQVYQQDYGDDGAAPYLEGN